MLHMTSHGSPRLRRPRYRRWAAWLLCVLVVIGGYQIWRLAAPPAGPKDCSPAAPPSPAGTTIINDVSCLNPTPVAGIVRVTSEDDIRRALAEARARRVKVSIAGVRHSQGGQAFAAGNIVLDMRGFNAIDIDEAARTIRVQSGATWHDIQNRLHPRFAVKAMQSTDLFTVGGSISVNAHGMDHRAGSVGRTVRWMRVMLADGTVRRLSRSEDAELFHLVAGGYGLFGVILDAEIEITPNVVYRSSREVLATSDFPSAFRTRVDGDPAIGLMYGHLSTSPGSRFQEMLLYMYAYTESASPRAPIGPLGDVRGVALRRFVLNASKLGGPAMRLKWWAEKHVEPWLESCPAGHEDGCLVSRNDPMHDSVPYLLNRLRGETDILQEYFVPHDRFVPFVERMRAIVEAHGANVLNASVRAVPRDDNVLNYAPGDRMAIVLYVNQETTLGGTERMARFTAAMIDLSIETGGRFFLPYQLHYTPDQLRRAYPEIDAFFAAKRAYDPAELFSNTFYNKFAGGSR
jgi:FAD/FMN-containing dehydrogenase